MRSKLLFLTFALLFSAASMLLAQTANVSATGPTTDNSTMPDDPVDDKAEDEIKPPVNYVLLEPSSQPEDTPPSFTLDFIGLSEKDKFKVTGDENWYLDVDINKPGWLYICEYFPVGDGFQGKWIVYKWQLMQSGIWRLGPFTAENNEPEGQHVYKIWFYSDGQWAAEDSSSPQDSLIYWTYSKGKPTEPPAEQIPPEPLPTPSKEASFSDKAYEFITRPVVLVLGSLVLVIMVMLGLYIYWRYARRWSNQHTASANEVEAQELSVALPSDVTSAKIALPNGLEIQLAGNSRVVGRADLVRALSLDDLGLISRQHFEVKSEDEQFYINDMDSANGTRLNGEDISGKGPVSLNDNDVIEPAGAIRLKFLLL
ncbi:MAG: FHA domain-containing protein [Dehalococcoidia bacterium]|nr:FHA domain-containing protein [Dehalococcoidia bacterium]